jgi:hypothetical protein
MWRPSCSLSIILAVSVSTACTHAVPPETPPLPTFESVTIESKGPSEELHARFGVAFRNSSVDGGLGIGAGTGAMLGAQAALGCGPYVFLCLMSFIPAGVVVGAIGGAVSGGIADAVADKQNKPLQDQLAVLDELFGDVVAQRTLDVEIRNALVRQIPPGRLPEPALADGLLQLSLFDVRFTQTSRGKYTLTLKSLLIAEWNHSTRHLNNGRRLYRHTTRERSLKEWAENDGENLNQAFDECVDSLGEQMAADIRFSKP